MLYDLTRDADAAPGESDVTIVGAGIAGLVLAARLREHGLSVTVLESGGRAQVGERHPLNEVVLLGADYAGAAAGRFRCLGGTSTRWGGALIPFLDHDLEPRPYLDLPRWPVRMEALLPYLPGIERLFAVDDGSYGETFAAAAGARIPMGDPDFVARFAKWPAFRRRNLATLLKARIDGDAGLRIWLNATVTGASIDPETGRLRELSAQAPGGSIRRFAARELVLCAGAIESTRLMLLFDRQHHGRIWRDCDALGRHFHDHVSKPVATIETAAPRALNRLAGFRFVGGAMRSLRFELSPQAQAADRVCSAFGHISMTPLAPGAFEGLRAFMRGLQQHGRLDLRALAPVIADLPYLARAAQWRLMRRQLAWPDAARHELHVVVEQVPQPENRITLADRLDPMGLPQAAIAWRVGDADRAVFAAYRARFERFWARHGLAALGRLRWSEAAESEAEMARDAGGGVYHPGGTTRMGTERGDAVLDGDLCSFAVPNLSVLSTSAFPTGGGANPTLTLMLFAHRLADRLSARARRPAEARTAAAPRVTHAA